AQDGRTLEEHLEAARKNAAEDSWRSSEAAEVEVKLALFLDADSARALAIYVENQILWREELLSPPERQKLEDTVRYAGSRAPESPDVERAASMIAHLRGDPQRCMEDANKALAQTSED